MPTVQIPLRAQLVVNGNTIDYPLLSVAVDQHVWESVAKIVKRQWIAGIDKSAGTDVAIRFPLLGEFADELVDSLMQYLREHWDELSVEQVESLIRQVRKTPAIEVKFDIDDTLGGIVGYTTLRVSL